MDFSSLYSSVERTVVQVLSLNTANQIISTGTGVIINSGSHVLTCNHCVVPGSRTGISFPGSDNVTLPQSIERFEESDIALLSFKGSIGPSAELSSSEVLIGQEAFTVGFPNNISSSTLLSAHVASFEEYNGFNLIRIDSSINYGNSGGPLFNTEGRVIGVVNAKHGSLSEFLQDIKNTPIGNTIAIDGIAPIPVIQQLLGEMEKNLNLGIGYSIPIQHISTLSQVVSNNIEV